MKLNLRSICLSIVSFASLCSLATIIQAQSLQELKSNTGSYTQAYGLSDTQLAVLKKMPVAGFQNVVADWSFIQFLQYFGDEEARQQTGYSDSAKYLSAAIHHDPYPQAFYIFLSGSSTLYAGMPKETVEVISEGLKQLSTQRAPDSYYVWRYKGTDELLFLNDGESAQKSFEMAADWAFRSKDEAAPAIAQASRQTAQFLADNPDSKAAQIGAWGSVLSNALDDRTRAHAVSKIRELGGDALLTENGQFKIKSSGSEDLSQ